MEKTVTRSVSEEDAQISRGAATSNSLGREPQEVVVETGFRAPEGRHPPPPDYVSPLRGFPLDNRLFLGLTPQAIYCRPSGTKNCATSSLTLRARICPKNASAARHRPPKRARRGAAALDYVLVMAVVLPLAGFLMWAGPRMMTLVYETTAVLISWPFL